jgi:Flp pilus assembly protein TadD
MALCLFALPAFAQSPPAPASQVEQEIRAGQYSRAEQDLLQALRRDSRNGSLWFSLGVIQAQLKKTDSAIEAFEKASQLTPQQAPVYFNLGLLYMEKSDAAQAEDAYQRGLALDPSNVPANRNHAFLLMQGRQFREASIVLDRLKKLTPDDVAVRATLIQAYFRAGLKTECENEIDDLFRSHLATLPQGLALARLLSTGGDTEDTGRVLALVVNSWPNSAEAHGELGLLLIQNDHFRDAAKELQQAVQLDPDSIKYSVGLGDALINSQQYPAALKFLLGARKQFANQPNIQYQLALTDVCLQRFAEAISILETLASESPNSGKVQFLLGGAYELSGELQKAETHYRSAIRLNPHEPTYYRVLASMLEKQGPEHLAESVQLARVALSLDPTDAQTKIVLAICLEKQGELDEAAGLLEQAAASNPDLRRAHSALAELYFRQKKFAQAEQEQAIAAKLEEAKITKDWNIWGPKTTGGP